MYLLPALYECARNNCPNSLAGYSFRGIIGGEVPIGGERDKQMIEIFKRWLIQFGELSHPDCRNYLCDDYKVILSRDYKVLFLGEGTSVDGNLQMLNNKISYDTVWLPNASYSKMIDIMLEDSKPSGCHNILNIPIPHYFRFKSQNDLHLRLWKGVRDTWRKLYEANINGAVNDCRLNEGMIVNVSLPSILSRSLFCCSLAKGINGKLISNLKDVQGLALAQNTNVIRGWNVWWRVLNNERNRIQNPFNIVEGECVSIIGVDDNTPKNVAVEIEITDEVSFFDIGGKQDQVTLSLKTREITNWIEFQQDDYQLRILPCIKSELIIDPLSIGLFFFVSSTTPELMKEYLLDVFPKKTARMNRDMFNKANSLSDRSRVRCTGCKANSLKSIRAELIEKRLIRVTPHACFQKWVNRGHIIEALTVEGWISSMQRISTQFELDHSFQDESHEGDGAIIRYVQFLYKIAVYLWNDLDSVDAICTINLIVLGTFIHLNTFDLGLFDGLKIEDTSICWFGEGSDQLRKFGLMHGLTRIVTFPSNFNGLSGFIHDAMNNVRKMNVVIINYPFEYIDGVDYSDLFDAIVKLINNTEVLLFRVRVGIVDVFRAISEKVANKGHLDVIRISKSSVPSEWYVGWWQARTPNDSHRNRLIEFVKPYSQSRRVITRAFFSEIKDIYTWIRRALLGEYLSPAGIEIDSTERDLVRTLNVAGCICRSFKVRSFSQGPHRAFRLSGSLDLDMILRNCRLKGERIEMISMDINYGLDLVRSLSPGLIFQSEFFAKEVNPMHALQATTNFIIKSWVDMYLNIMPDERFYLIDVGGRRGELSGWVTSSPRITYISVDPESLENIPKGSITLENGRPASWNFLRNPKEEAARILTLHGLVADRDQQIILIFSNVLSNVLERNAAAGRIMQQLVRHIDDWTAMVFIRDMSTFHGESFRPRSAIRNDYLPMVKSKFMKDFVFDRVRGYIPSAYPNVQDGLESQMLNGIKRMRNWAPCYKEILDVLYARGMKLDSFGEFILPMLLKHVVYLGTIRGDLI
ncbi:VP3 [Kundal virus]|uniref:VP3 n=1 Tax=Kundal virus TaxID=2290890 RepID=A0A499RIH4_9REOV|nr:VP3 [Kundal virus]AXG65495.1 VP3 [Kundal virus]